MSNTKQKPVTDGLVVPSIELVGGPLCGTRVDWPMNKQFVAYAYYGGEAEYKFESDETAIYVKG